MRGSTVGDDSDDEVPFYSVLNIFIQYKEDCDFIRVFNYILSQFKNICLKKKLLSPSFPPLDTPVMLNIVKI